MTTPMPKKKQSVAWNKDKTKSVVLSKLKEFTIQETFHSPQQIFAVRGWYNQENFFLFGEFNTVEEARDFLEQIHNMF